MKLTKQQYWMKMEYGRLMKEVERLDAKSNDLSGIFESQIGLQRLFMDNPGPVVTKGMLDQAHKMYNDAVDKLIDHLKIMRDEEKKSGINIMGEENTNE